MFARPGGWEVPPQITFFDVLVNEKARISWGEIALSAAVAVLLGAIVSAITNHHLVYRVAQRLGISRKFGDPDVWSYFLNSPDTLWVAVRDIAADTVYEGAVEAFSDTVAAPELLLRTVRVSRSSTDTELYECDRAYLSRDRRRWSSSRSEERVCPTRFLPTGPLPPRPDRPPRPTGFPGWVVQPPPSYPPRP